MILSGGQILKGIAERGMNLDRGATVQRSTNSRALPDEKQFKANYRQAMNDLPIDDATADRIVDEANAAFGMNMKLFQELEGNLIKAIGAMLFNSLTRRRNPWQHRTSNR